MKKIGLITLHSFHNYGSMLQAYALNHYLDTFNKNVSCEIIDYVPPRQDNNRAYRLYNNEYKQEYQALREKYASELVARRKKFSEFMTLYHLGQQYHSDEEIEANPPLYDIYVSGSDQIWNVNFRIASRAYFLSFTDSTEKFAFSTSVGRCKIDKLRGYESFIQAYKKIYIREASGAARIRKLTGRDNVGCMIDPTWLFDAEKWNHIIPKARITALPYIACYATLDDQLQDMLPILEKLHQTMSLPVVLFGMVLPQEKSWIINIVDAGPREFLQIIRDAELVFTMSFHGTIFSMNFNKPFLTYNDASENFRKVDVLKQFGLRGRIIHKVDELDKALAEKIDYTTVNQEIAKVREDAKHVIADCLGC